MVLSPSVSRHKNCSWSKRSSTVWKHTLSTEVFEETIYATVDQDLWNRLKLRTHSTLNFRIKLADTSFFIQSFFIQTTVSRQSAVPQIRKFLSWNLRSKSRTKKVTLCITVLDYDRMGKNEAIGKLVLGCGASGTGMSSNQHAHLICKAE